MTPRTLNRLPLTAAVVFLTALTASAEPASPEVEVETGSISIQNLNATPLDKAKQARLVELDAYWAEVSRAVKEGDFEAYKATCHDEGVLVSGSKLTTQPLAKILKKWKQDFIDARDGTRKCSVAFRFSRRIGDATTAHETGIFLYTSQKPGEAAEKEYIRLEALLVKRQGAWKILMENQKGSATEAAWNALK
jgi:ketosteroid isomerase-like protein